MSQFVQDKEKFKNRQVLYDTQSKVLLKEAETVLGHSALASEEREHYGNVIKMQVEAQEGIALEKAGYIHDKVDAESQKTKDERKKDYEKAVLEHGGGVTMETAAMKRNLKRFQKSWTKEKAKLTDEQAAEMIDVSGNLFEIAFIKGSKQHIDIKKIMYTLNVLEKYDGKNIDNLNIPEDKKLKLKVGLAALAELRDVKEKILEENALDEEGNIIAKREDVIKEGSENTQIAELLKEKEMLSHSDTLESAINRYKDALAAAYQAQENGRTNLEPSGQEKIRLQELLAKKNTEYEKERQKTEDDLKKRKNSPSGTSTGDIDKLLEDCCNWHKEENFYKADIEAKKALAKELEKTKGKEKEAANIRALLLLDEQNAEYKEAHYQHLRYERMFLGVCEGKPLTADMRMELFRDYGFTEYEEKKIAKIDQQKKAAAVLSARNKMQGKSEEELQKELKEKGRKEKEADYFQNFLGGRSIDSLSKNEKEKYKEYIDYIKTEDTERKINIQELENWLAADAEISGFKDALNLDKNKILDENEQKTLSDKFDGLCEKVSSVLEKADIALSSSDYVTGFALGDNYDDSLYDGISEYAGHGLAGVSNLVSVVTGVKSLTNWKENETEDNIEAVSDTLSGLTDFGRMGLEIFTKTEEVINVADKATGELIEKTVETTTGTVARMLGGGVDIIGGISGITTSSMKVNEAGTRTNDTQNTMDEFKNNLTTANEQVKSELKKLSLILKAANQSASIELADGVTNIVTNCVKTIMGAAKMISGPVGEVIEAPIKLVTFIAEKVSERIAISRKATLRREYVTEHFNDLIEKIKKNNLSGNKFANLSDRDIKHTFLKFLGAQSGKRSEAGIRKIAVDSKHLMERANDSTEVQDYKIKTLKAMGLEETSKRPEIMQAMGATEEQSKNPLKESNRIYRDQLKRSKNFGEWAITRGLRKAWRWAFS